MRLLGGIVLVVIAFVLVLASPLATFYHVHTVGPDFRTVGPDGPTDEDETRQLDGEWTLTGYQLSNITWDRDMNAWERDWDQYSFYGEGSDIVNERGRKVYVETGAALVAGVVALGLGSFGIWNVAQRDRYRWFTAASLFLAGVMFAGGCYHFATALPEAMWSDSTSGVGSFGDFFAPYIDPEGGEPGYFFEFSGGYPSEDSWLREQLQYGPGYGWWLMGAASIAALVASAVMIGAPSWNVERESTGPTIEVVRYVPVPTVTNLRKRRRYPKRMPAVSRNSPTYRKGRERDRV